MSAVTLEYVNRNISYALKRTSHDNFAMQNKFSNPCFSMTYKDICSAEQEHGKNMDSMPISFNCLKKAKARTNTNTNTNTKTNTKTKAKASNKFEM